MVGKLRDYIASFIDLSEISEEFDYTFNLDSELEKYKNEFSKFVKTYNSFFFSKNRLLYMWNNYEIILKQEDVEQLLKMYLYSQKICNKDYLLISEFLISYNNTIRNKKYKENVLSYKEVNSNYKNALNKYNMIDNPYITFLNYSYNFYNMLIDYCIEEDEPINPSLIERICTNLLSDSTKLNSIIDKFIDNNINLSLIISFDKNVDKHINNYNNYIIKYINENNFYKYPEHIIFELEKCKLLSTDILKVIINNIIDRLNELYDKAINKKENFIQILATIDDLTKSINKFFQRLESMSSIQKEKLNECLNNLLTIKRYILSDNDYINSQLKEFSYQTTIPNEQIKEIVEDINNNFVRLYAHSKVDFEYQMKETLKSYSQHAILSVVSVFSIDSSQQMYFKPNDIIVNNFFKKHYDEIGKKYTLKNKKLVNRLSKDYYEEMLKYLGKTFLMHQHMLYSFLKENNKFDSMIEQFKKMTYTTNYDDYMIVASNVMYIEASILDLLEKNNLEITDDGRTNLYTLSTHFKNDKFVVNGLMYINYILYEISGLNIRNNVAHGMIINKNIDIEVMITFSAIVFIQYLIQKYGDMR